MTKDMEYSRHNIFSRVRGRDQWFLVNLLSGEADLLDQAVADAVAAGAPPPADFTDTFIEKGYWVNPAEERQRYDAAYARFKGAAAREEVQLFYLLSYACNFTCDYCYQSGYDPERATDRTAATDAFFKFVDKHFRGVRKYVTLFGGEPLLPGNYDHVADIIKQLNARALGLAIVTNGYTLPDYLPLLKTAAVREVQVTLDGPPALHNQRRPLGG
ncbi:MAG: radical SAM protein, partial [Gemmatimonadaceae bacterium]